MDFLRKLFGKKKSKFESNNVLFSKGNNTIKFPEVPTTKVSTPQNVKKVVSFERELTALETA